MIKTIIFISLCIHCTYSLCDIESIPSPSVTVPFALNYDDRTNSLYFCDFLASANQNTIFRVDLETNEVKGAQIEGNLPVSFIVPAKETNLFVVGSGNGSAIIEWDGTGPSAKIVQRLFTITTDNPGGIIGLGRQGHQGRLYVGGLVPSFCSGPNTESLYAYSKGTGLKRLITGMKLTAGIAFDGNNNVYHADTCHQLITVFSGNRKGDVCDGRVWFDFSTKDVFPIGLDVDLSGNLYTGNYKKGDIWTVNSKTGEARVLATLPVNGVIGGIVIGGKQRDTMYVVVGTIRINVDDGSVAETIPNIPSVWKITKIGSKGFGTKRANV